MSAVGIHGVTHQYGETRALDDVSFDVPWGQVCGLLGPNGAGKTTLLSILTGTLEPTSGEVQVAGHAPRDGLSSRRVLGVVPDSGGLYGLLSAREHLHLAADLHELDPAAASAEMDRLSQQFGIDDILDQRIDTLSKGQRQRTAICCGLLHEPRILLLDEPLNGLDVSAVRVLREEITTRASNGAAVLYCSHILDVVERLCERAIILSDGRVVADAPTSDLVAAAGADATLESVFHDLTRSDDVEGLAGALDA